MVLVAIEALPAGSRVRECVTRFPVVLLVVLSETEVVAYLGHSSLNPELSQFIVPKLIWPSSGTFQRHHQLSTSEDTASCLLGRLDTHQRASVCDQLEIVSRTSLILGDLPRKNNACCESKLRA